MFSKNLFDKRLFMIFTLLTVYIEVPKSETELWLLNIRQFLCNDHGTAFYKWLDSSIVLSDNFDYTVVFGSR